MKTILVIEDEAQIRQNIAALLKLEGYRVLEASDGRLGTELANSENPDLILCDVAMPDMDGFEVIHAIRRIAALNAVPFIFLTARSHASDVRAGMNLGADDYLPKPFTASELLAAIEARMTRVKSLLGATQVQPTFDSTVPLEALGLTPSEASVLLWMAQGKGNADIATILECTVGTVKKHAQRIFDKLGVDNRTGAMIVARETLAARVQTG